MEQIKKMKIAMICGFSSLELRNHLKLKQNRYFFKFLIRLFGLPDRVGNYSDYAPWIPLLVEQFKKRKDIELHIISEHIGLNSSVQEFEMDGIFYHIYSAEFSSFFRKFDNLKLWKLLQRNSVIVKRIVERINPDLINIVGIENPTTGVAALYLENRPIYILSQTIYSNPKRKELGNPKKLNWDLEVSIHKKLKYFAVYSPVHRQLLLNNNPNAIIFDYHFPVDVLPKVKECDKIYDFVNFALQLDSRKGAQDTVKALAIVKKQFPNVKLNFVGRCDAVQREELNVLIYELDLMDNIEFTPFFEKQIDMFQHIQKSKNAVLPCKLDFISGTQFQSMYYGLPLVVYKTAGTVTLNKNKECVLIAELEDVNDLAKKMLILMSDDIRREKLKQNAMEMAIAEKEEDNSVVEHLVDNYKLIIDHYYNGKVIPDDKLFHDK